MMKKLEILKTNRTWILIESVWASSVHEEGDGWEAIPHVTGWRLVLRTALGYKYHLAPASVCEVGCRQGLRAMSRLEVQGAVQSVGKIAQGNIGITKPGVCQKDFTSGFRSVLRFLKKVRSEQTCDRFHGQFLLCWGSLRETQRPEKWSIAVSLKRLGGGNRSWILWKSLLVVSRKLWGLCFYPSSPRHCYHGWFTVEASKSSLEN